MDFAIGGAAAVCAGFFTNPLEVVKVRMQLQGELLAKGKHAVHYKNVFHAGYVIAKHDGILALQAGLVPALWFQLVLNGCRFGAYQILMDRGYMKDKQGNMVFYKTVIGGGLVGAAGGLLASPFYLIKVHLQSKAASKIAFGHQHDHQGTWSAFRKIYNEHGVRGLFRGASSALPRVFFGSMAQLTSFSYSKELLVKYEFFPNSQLTTSFVSSMIGGLVAVLLITPFDLVSTRIYNQGIDERGKGLLYSGYIDCVLKIWKSEGIYGFYKGIGANYFRLGPHTVLSLVFWDQFKYLYAKMYPNKKRVQ